MSATSIEPRPQSLEDIQRLMCEAIMKPLTGSDAMQPRWTESGQRTAEIAGTFIKPNDRLSAFARLEIYNQQYWWRLRAAMEEDFPGVRAVLGKRRFAKLVVAYLQECPSSSWTLRNLGAKLPEFIRTKTTWTEPYTALALDMARTEWAKIEAFDEAEWPRLEAQAIASQDPARMQLYLQPHLRLLKLDYPIDTLVGKLRRHLGKVAASASNAVSGESSGDADPSTGVRLRTNPSTTPIYLAAHRVEYSVYYKRIPAEAHALLTALRDGLPLEAAIEAAFEQSQMPEDERAPAVQAWFQTWMNFGWLCGSAGEGDE